MTPSEPAGEDTARDGTRDDVRDAVAESHRATDATTTRVVRVVSDSDDESVEEDIPEEDIPEEDIAEEDIAEEDIADASFACASDAPEEPRSKDAAPVPSPGPSSPDAEMDADDERPPRRSLGERSDASISASISPAAASPRASATLVASPSRTPPASRGVPEAPPSPTSPLVAPVPVRAPAPARRGGATSPKAPSPPAKRAAAATATARMNPVLAREAALARRRRDAARRPEKRATNATAKRDGARGSETARTEPERKSVDVRAIAEGRPSTDPEPATVPESLATTVPESLAPPTPDSNSDSNASAPLRRRVRVDLVSALPEFSAAVAAALAASGAKGYLVAPDEELEEANAAHASPKARVAMVADAPAVRSVAAQNSAYRPTPAHKTYAWYKHYGFAGKGAKTSWGYNPKRQDIKARYDDVKGRRE